MEKDLNSIQISNVSYSLQETRMKIYIENGVDIYCFGKMNPYQYLDGFEAKYKRKFEIRGKGKFVNDAIVVYNLKNGEKTTVQNVVFELQAYETEGLILDEFEEEFENKINQGILRYFNSPDKGQILLVGINTSIDVIENMINNYMTNTEMEIDIDVNLFNHDILDSDNKNEDFIYESIITPNQNFDVKFLDYVMFTSLKKSL